MKKLQIEDENNVLRQSIEKYSAIEIPRWDISTETRVPNENGDKFGNLYKWSAPDRNPVRLFNISVSNLFKSYIQFKLIILKVR